MAAAASPSSSALPTALRRPVALVGAGALGTALAGRLHACGVPVCAVLSRTEARAEALAQRVGAPVASADLAALPPAARVVLLCVPDDAIDAVAARLAEGRHAWAGVLVAHTAGARPALPALAPLAEAGAVAFSFHPVQAFAAATPPEAFDGIVVGVEGAEAGAAYGRALAQALGARPVHVPSDAKTRYHLAAALASNGLVALAAAATDVLASIGLDADDARALLRPLLARTQANLAAAPPEDALTGPAARGDAATVAAHARALRTHAPRLAPLYAALTRELVRLATRHGTLDADAAAAVRTALAPPEGEAPG
jgi:predicted short-subunit dehydrogenase-like oxidoreductase (DUF2520 family)